MSATLARVLIEEPSLVESPSCPRCGYDLSGARGAWRERCPLDGVCPECGLGYEWRDVFRPERLTPRWSFEHARAGPMRSWLATAARTLRPARFWTRMRVESPVRTGRLVVLALGVVLATHVVIALLWGSIGYAQSRAGYPAGWLGIIAEPWDSALSLTINPYTPRGRFVPAPLTILPFVAAVWGLGAALPFACLGPSLRRARVKRVHVLRAWAYFVPTVAVLVLGSAVYWTAHAHILARGLWRWWMWNTTIWMVVLAGPLVLWYWWWWRSFVGTYLRLDRPGLTAALMLTVSGLAVLAVAAYVPGSPVADEAAWLWVMLTR